MTTPVFVIHGIGARDRDGFSAHAKDLGRRANFAAHPVFWGDLGARSAFVQLTIPGGADETRDDNGPDDIVHAIAISLTSEQGGQDEIRDRSLPPEALAAALAALEGGSEIRDNPPPDRQAVEAALRSVWPTTTWLARIDDPLLLAEVGAAVTRPLTEAPAAGLSGAGGGTEELRDGPVEIRGLDVVGFVRRRVTDLDRVVGAAFGSAAGRVNTYIRSNAGPRLTEVLGDVLVYQRHRAEIQARVRVVIDAVDPGLGRDADHPIDVVAHSLGGVIAVDMATDDEPLWIRQLVTFGSQAPFFHVCDPRGGELKPYGGTGLVSLPPSLAAWTNLWEPMDVVAFIAAKVFQLPDGSSPRDLAVPHLVSSGLWTHSSYWNLDSVAQDIATALGGVGRSSART
jgi:hypothetical protein